MMCNDIDINMMVEGPNLHWAETPDSVDRSSELMGNEMNTSDKRASTRAMQDAESGMRQDQGQDGAKVQTGQDAKARMRSPARALVS